MGIKREENGVGDEWLSLKLKTISSAKAGVHKHPWWSPPRIPAYAGMTAVIPYERELVTNTGFRDGHRPQSLVTPAKAGV